MSSVNSQFRGGSLDKKLSVGSVELDQGGVPHSDVGGGS